MKEKNSILRIIGIILLVFLLLFVINLLGKMFVIHNLQNKLEPYLTESNYHIKTNQHSKDNLVITETLKKEDDFQVTYSSFSENDTKKMVRSLKENYIEHNGEKVAEITSGLPIPTVGNFLQTNNLWDFINTAITSSITKQGCNEKECYVITTTERDNGVLNSVMKYIDKDTGLTVRIVTSSSETNSLGSIIDYSYEFENVTDEDFN